jgi:hypothetical protein
MKDSSQCGKENISLGAVFQPNQYPTNSGSTLSVPREHQQQQQYTQQHSYLKAYCAPSWLYQQAAMYYNLEWPRIAS